MHRSNLPIRSGYQPRWNCLGFCGVLALVWLLPSRAADAQVIKSAISSAKPSKVVLASQATVPQASKLAPQVPRLEPLERQVESHRPIVDGRTVAMQAAACWPPARLLHQRAATLEGEGQQHGDAGRRASLAAFFLRKQAERQRDVAAAMALRAYYSWLANRLQQGFASEGLALLDQQAALETALANHGIAVDDPTALERQRLEVQDQSLQLQQAADQLAQTLLQLTACASDVRHAEVEGWEIRPTEVRCQELVAYALAHRADYQAWLKLCECLDSGTVGTVVDLLSPLVGGVDVDLVGGGWLVRCLHLAHAGEKVEAVGREVRTAIAWQRRLIEQSICDKCAALTLAYQRVALAEQVEDSWKQRIAALERAEQLGNAKGELLQTARAAQIRARVAVGSRQLEAKLAEVDLADAVGGLAVRCEWGYPWLVTEAGGTTEP